MNPFVAEIRIFPFNFAPTGWAVCNGQLLAISQNTALFSLLGTTYGGDGKSTFALPDLQGSAPMHPGQGPGLSLHDLGETGGTDYVTLLQSEMPGHNHQLNCADGRVTGQIASPGPTVVLAAVGGGTPVYAPGTPNQQLNVNSVSPAGGGQPHNNMMPYLTLTFCIALQGIYPPRT